MSDSDNGEKAQLNVPASSAPAVEKKAARARAKKVKQGLACPNLVGKKATLEGAIEDNVDPSCPFFVRGKLDFEELVMWDRLIREYRRKSMKNDIITSDPTSKKIFMDTIMLLAKETDNLVDELWNYITGRKPRQTAILLLAAHEQIRGVSSSKRNVKGKQNEFPVIMNRIMEQLSSTNTNGENGNTEEMVEERMKLCEMFRLVHIISEAGEDLKKYIQAHSEATHAEVLEHISTILKDHGFCPTGGIDVRNLHPYACKTFGTKLYDKGHVDVAKEVLEMIRGTSEKAVREKPMQGWDPDYSRRMFFPYWRSVLNAKCRVKMYPYYAPLPLPKLDVKEHWNPQSNSTAAGSSQEPNHNLGWLGRQQLKSNQQPIRTFSTASFAVLKKALRK